MKYAVYLLYLTFMYVISGCGDNSNSGNTQVTASEHSKEASSVKEGVVTNNNSPRGEGIVGYWKLNLEAYDENNNRKLDEEERKKGISNRYSFRFNANGSCEIMDLFKGRYEINEKNGQKILSVFRNRVVAEEATDPPPDEFSIIEMTGDEMVLLEKLGDHTFWVFKKQ